MKPTKRRVRAMKLTERRVEAMKVTERRVEATSGPHWGHPTIQSREAGAARSAQARSEKRALPHSTLPRLWTDLLKGLIPLPNLPSP